jgi:hypothetical protein
MARGPAWNADHIAGLGKEAAPVHFVKTAALENAKNLGLRMLAPGRALAWRIDGFDDREGSPLAAGAMRTKRSSPIAGIVIGASAPFE